MSRANDLTKQVIKYLRLNGCEVWRQNNNPTPIRKGKQVTGFRAFSGRKGVPDVIGFTPDGRFIGVEVKAGRDRLSIEQRDFLDTLNRSGGIGIEARSIDDVIDRIVEIDAA